MASSISSHWLEWKKNKIKSRMSFGRLMVKKQTPSQRSKANQLIFMCSPHVFISSIKRHVKWQWNSLLAPDIFTLSIRTVAKKFSSYTLSVFALSYSKGLLFFTKAKIMKNNSKKSLKETSVWTAKHHKKHTHTQIHRLKRRREWEKPSQLANDIGLNEK